MVFSQPGSPHPVRAISAAVGVFVATLLVLLAAPAAAGANTVSGTEGNPVYEALTYTLTGAEFALKPGASSDYTATYSGSAPVTLSGTMTITRSASIVSSVQMTANVGATQWQWPATGGFQSVSGTTITESFSVSQAPTPADYALGYMSGGAAILACGDGVCAKRDVRFAVLLPSAPITTPPTPAPTTDTEPPTVKALPIGKILKIGTRYKQHYWVKDNSQKAYVYASLFDAGTKIGSAASQGPIAARGFHEWANVTPGRERKGPLEFCVYARDTSGNYSANSPKSSCSWLDVRVPIKNVSNQCGGAGWDKVVQFQNWVGNTSNFSDPGTGETYPVDFRDACNLHDAGYGGRTVADMLAGTRGHRPTVNFRKWSRGEVDAKFLSDMQKLCRRDIPKAARTARAACVNGTGRYNAVRAIGGFFFDADLRTAGIQATGHRLNDGPMDAVSWLP